MMSGHGANPIFCNKKNKDWTSRALAIPYPATSDNIPFFHYTPILCALRLAETFWLVETFL